MIETVLLFWGKNEIGKINSCLCVYKGRASLSFGIRKKWGFSVKGA